MAPPAPRASPLHTGERVDATHHNDITAATGTQAVTRPRPFQAHACWSFNLPTMSRRS